MGGVDQTKKAATRKYTFFACTFCFSISHHVMLLWRIVSFKCRLWARANVRITYEKTKGKFPWEYLKWENITYKQRSYIGFWQIMWPRPFTLDLILPVVYACMSTNIFCYFTCPLVRGKLHDYFTWNYVNPQSKSATDWLTCFSVYVLKILTDSSIKLIDRVSHL